MPATLLALDTSTDACSVALKIRGEILAKHEIAPRQHNKLLLSMLENLLNAAGLDLSKVDAIAFGCGPGSFTGLRLAASVVQAIAFAHDIPVIPVSSMQAIAQGCYREFDCSHVITAVDAAMQEVYYGAYTLKNAVMVSVQGESIAKPEAITIPSYGHWAGAGNGWDLYAEIFQQKIGAQLQQWFPQRYPKAEDIIELASKEYRENKILSAEAALPIYLREVVVKNG